MKELMKKNEGITLIALIITIIILIILAAITINNVIGTDLIGFATKGAESYQIASEREYLEQNILLVQAGKYIGNVSAEKLGDTLNTKNLMNSSNWHIIKVKDKTYETGWNYIERGTELKDYGQAKNDWLVNYETGEIIQLEKDNYMSLSAGDMLAIKDSLIINIDSSIIDEKVENEQGALEEQLGENVELVNFDYNTESGLTNTSFNFDGKDDYIKVQYDKQEQKDALAKNGFTFEFYGIWDGGTTAPPNIDEYKGLFCYWNGEENMQAIFRFGIIKKKNTIMWNAGFDKSFSDFSKYNTGWNQRYEEIDLEELKKGAYITITVDTTNSYPGEVEEYSEKGDFYNQAMYLNGEILYEGKYNKKQWDDFVKNYLNDLKYFCFGRSSMNEGGSWHYSKMNAYALRLYSRGLSKEEVMKNYEKSVEYHSLSTK